MRGKLSAAIAAGLLCAGVAACQERPAGFTEKPFVPAAARPVSHRAYWALVGIHAGVTVADIWSTERLFKYPTVYEINPLLPRRPSTARISIEFAALSVAGIVGTHYLETHGHPRLAKVVLIGLTGSESFAVGNNLLRGVRLAHNEAKH
jgi:hypothetical protein